MHCVCFYFSFFRFGDKYDILFYFTNFKENETFTTFEIFTMCAVIWIPYSWRLSAIGHNFNQTFMCIKHFTLKSFHNCFGTQLVTLGACDWEKNLREKRKRTISSKKMEHQNGILKRFYRHYYRRQLIFSKFSFIYFYFSWSNIHENFYFLVSHSADVLLAGHYLLAGQ